MLSISTQYEKSADYNRYSGDTPGIAVRRLPRSPLVKGNRSLALLLAALGSAAPAAHAMDACALLTREEVAAVVKSAVTPGERRDAGKTSEGAYSLTCLWKIVTTEAEPQDQSAPLGGRSFVILNVIISPHGSMSTESYIQSFRDAAADHTIPGHPVPLQLGDEALWWGDGVAVRKGDVSFGISVFLTGRKRSTFRSMDQKLATMILGRL
jgi:hypothetical protein